MSDVEDVSNGKGGTPNLSESRQGISDQDKKEKS